MSFIVSSTSIKNKPIGNDRKIEVRFEFTKKNLLKKQLTNKKLGVNSKLPVDFLSEDTSTTLCFL